MNFTDLLSIGEDSLRDVARLVRPMTSPELQSDIKASHYNESLNLAVLLYSDVLYLLKEGRHYSASNVCRSLLELVITTTYLVSSDRAKHKIARYRKAADMYREQTVSEERVRILLSQSRQNVNRLGLPELEVQMNSFPGSGVTRDILKHAYGLLADYTHNNPWASERIYFEPEVWNGLVLTTAALTMFVFLIVGAKQKCLDEDDNYNTAIGNLNILRISMPGMDK